MSFEPITTQEDLDKIVGARLAREREKFADYDALKAAAAEGAEAIAERDALRADLLGARREQIAAAAGIPVDLVVGSDVETMQAHADGIAAAIAERTAAAAAATSAPDPAPAESGGPYVPGVGNSAAPAPNPLADLFG